MLGQLNEANQAGDLRIGNRPAICAARQRCHNEPCALRPVLPRSVAADEDAFVGFGERTRVRIIGTNDFETVYKRIAADLFLLVLSLFFVGIWLGVGARIIVQQRGSQFVLARGNVQTHLAHGRRFVIRAYRELPVQPERNQEGFVPAVHKASNQIIALDWKRMAGREVLRR